MKTAMILAAGRGERLKPLTLKRPKAMCLIHGVPVIEYHVRALVRAGFTHLVINHAYLGDCIYRYFADGEAFGVTISYSPEPPGGLETGGGIVNALPLLGDEPFVAVNADVVTAFDFAKLHLPEKTLAHLILVDNPLQKAQGDFGLDDALRLTNQPQYTYSGIACYHPELFKECRPGRYSLTPMLRKLAEKKRISGEHYAGRWLDIGSIEQLKRAEQFVLNDSPLHGCA